MLIKAFLTIVTFGRSSLIDKLTLYPQNIVYDWDLKEIYILISLK